MTLKVYVPPLLNVKSELLSFERPSPLKTYADEPLLVTLYVFDSVAVGGINTLLIT